MYRYIFFGAETLKTAIYRAV